MYILSLYSLFEANNVDPYQTPHNVASDLGLHCLPMTLFRVFLVRLCLEMCHMSCTLWYFLCFECTS